MFVCDNDNMYHNHVNNMLVMSTITRQTPEPPEAGQIQATPGMHVSQY